MIKKKRLEIEIHIVLSFVILMFVLMHIDEMNNLSVLNDEFGYWGIAAYITGYDWGPLMEYTPYYSFGYSGVLAVILTLVKMPSVAYKIAIAVNALFLVGTYFCTNCILRKMYPSLNFIARMFISWLITVLTPNLFQSQIAWSETLLVFLMWLSFLLFVSLEEKYAWYKVILFFAILGCMYIVHQRTIGILLAGLFAYILFCIVKNHNWKLQIGVLIIIAVCIFIQSQYKEYLLNGLWKSSGISDINNVGLDVKTFSNIFESFIHDALWLIKSLGGKIVVSIVSSAYFIIIGIVVIVYETFTNIKNKKIKKITFSKIYVLLAFIGMILICAIQTKYPLDRLDYIVYSRYFDNTIGPLCLIGIIEYIFEIRKKNIFCIIFGLILVIIGLPYIRNIMIDGGTNSFNVVCSPIIGAFWELSEDITLTLLGVKIFVFILALVLIGINFIPKIHIKTILVVLLMSIYWIGSYNIAYLNSESDWRNTVDNNTSEIIDLVADTNETVYYLVNSELDMYCRNAKFVQFAVPQKTIQTVTFEELNSIMSDSEEHFLLLTDKNETRLIEEKVLTKSDFLKVYKI